MYRPVHSAAAQHHLVRRVDDGVNRECRYVALYHFDFHANILPNSVDVGTKKLIMPATGPPLKIQLHGKAKYCNILA